jgi:hypothetical protein
MAKNHRKKRSKDDLRDDFILSTYDMFDDEDVSTERLLCMVADYCNCDIDDVTDVLIRYRT